MVVLVRFGEIALKSRYVRRQFTDALIRNIHQAFAAAGEECITRRGEGRVYVHSDRESAAVAVLRKVFGIVSVSPATEVAADMEEICDVGAEMAAGPLRDGMTFAVRSRRTGSHEFSSQDVAVALGRAVQDAVPGTIVDLTEPEVELFVEVRGPRAFLFTERVKGPGGLPLGTQGTVLARVADERAAVAAWMMMRRGCTVVVAGEGATVDALRSWNPSMRVLREADDSDAAAEAEGAEAWVSGSAIPEGDSSAGQMPTFYPTVGLSDADISEYWRMIQSEGEADEEP